MRDRRAFGQGLCSQSKANETKTRAASKPEAQNRKISTRDHDIDFPAI